MFLGGDKMSELKFQDKANLIWDIANVLRNIYKESEYGNIILPLTVMRRMDCVLADTKEKVLAQCKQFSYLDEKALDPILKKASGQNFYNTSEFDFDKLVNVDNENIEANLRDYINGFSPEAREILDNFKFDKEINKLSKNKILYATIKKFVDTDLSLEAVSTIEMGYVFEELIRKFSEQSNETAGEHFTPREVIKLMVHVLYDKDNGILSEEMAIRTMYDPACGTGGILAVAEEYINEYNSSKHAI